MRRPSAAGLGFLAAGAALAVAALLVAPGRAPRTPGQVELRLAVESLAADGDLAFEARDAERYRQAFGSAALNGFRLAATRPGAAPAGARAPAGQAGDAGRAPQLRAPWLWSRLAAGTRRVGGWPAVFLLQAALVLAAGALTARAARARLGAAGAAALALAVTFASAVGCAALELVPEALTLAAAAAAVALLWGRGGGPTVEPADVYRGDLRERSGAWRWPLAGAALGVVASGSPAYLPLALPLLAAAPPGRRLARGASLAAAAAAVFALIALAGTWPWPPLELWYDPQLLGWAAVGLLAGRHVGVATWYLVAALGLAAPAREEGRRFVPLAVLAALALALVTAPFDLAGDSGALANPWFLPALPLLAALPARLPGRGALPALALVSLALAAPGWLSALDLDGRAWARPVAALRAWLPADSTLRAVPDAAVLERAGIVLAGAPPEVLVAGDGTLRVTGRRARLAVESPAPLAALRLELGGAAPVDLAVRGARAGDLVLRPDGDVALEVELGPPARRHPTWRSPRGAFFYEFTLELPRAPVAPLPLDFSLARPLAAGQGDG